MLLLRISLLVCLVGNLLALTQNSFEHFSDCSLLFNLLTSVFLNLIFFCIHLAKFFVLITYAIIDRTLIVQYFIGDDLLFLKRCCIRFFCLRRWFWDRRRTRLHQRFWNFEFDFNSKLL